MRKIEQQIIDAIRAKRALAMANTAVTFADLGSGDTSMAVTLHGHLIAHAVGGKLTLDWCGWNTPTTRSRLNAVLDALGLNRAGAPRYAACVKNSNGLFVRWNDGEKNVTIGQDSITLQVPA
jgi:hypothetical protein